MGSEFNYNVENVIATGLSFLLGLFIFLWIIVLGVVIFSIISTWKVYRKAGKKGWESIIPIYNYIVLLRITHLPMWYLILFLVPIVNIVIMVFIYIELAKKFGESEVFGIGLTFLNPIFMGMLAFNKNYVYHGVETRPIYNSEVNYTNQYYQHDNYNSQQASQQEVNPGSYCSRCGMHVSQDDRFCMNCGNQL